MSITLDNHASFTNSVSNTIGSFAVGVLTNGVLTLFLNSLAGHSPLTVAYGGVPMTHAPGTFQELSSNRATDVWVLANPPAGTHAITTTNNGSWGFGSYVAASFDGVDQGTVYRDAGLLASGGGHPALSLGSVSGDLMLAMVGGSDLVGDGSTQADTGQMQLDGVNSSLALGVCLKAATTTTTTMGWGNPKDTGTLSCGIAGLVLIPAIAAVSFIPPGLDGQRGFPRSRAFTGM